MYPIIIKHVYNVKRFNCKLITVKQEYLRIKDKHHELGTGAPLSPIFNTPTNPCFNLIQPFSYNKRPFYLRFYNLHDSTDHFLVGLI